MNAFDAFALGCGVGAAVVAIIVYVAGRLLMTGAIGNQDNV